ncbi:MAG TPA: Asp-tRNA(Asn)/Glu-tRNA(Gln) amidotransferase subunit GatC [Ktedonobacterales bacterium]|jgi:aspartyl-tRNA(Asn)/glutamyl-tRNA(Gln) amidotransferase subunit C
MAITREDVENVALLARLGLNEEEKERLMSQLGVILENMAILNEVDVSQVPASAYILPVRNVMAPDQPRPSDQPRQLLANAPEAEENFLRVPAVLEEAGEEAGG